MIKLKKNKELMAKVLIFIFLLFAVAVVFWFYFLINDLPGIKSLKEYRPPVTSRVFDSKNNIIAEYYTENRTLVSMSDISKKTINAFLAAEDSDFYNHQGIDYAGLIRAIGNEIKYKIIGGKRIGGSTITQQTAKIMLLSRKRTYARKIKELILAKNMEDNLTKDEILNLYLNEIYFGNGVYGIEEAAKKYYGVSAKNLNLGQAAALAAIPKSPNKINPLSNPKRVEVRKKYVLEQMLINNFANEAEINEAQLEPVSVAVKKNKNLNKAPYYTEAVRQILIDKFGYKEVYNGGLRVHTPLDIEMQKAAKDALKNGLRKIDKTHGWRGAFFSFDNDEEENNASDNVELNKSHYFSENKNKKKIWNFSHVSKKELVEKNKILQKISLKKIKVGKIVLVPVLFVNSDKNTAKVLLGPIEAEIFERDSNWTKINKMEKILKKNDFVFVKVINVSPLIICLEQEPEIEGAIVAISPIDNRVKALTGGFNFNKSNFNRATQAKRQAGSAFKPFIYSLAIDRKIVTPATLITDAPRVFFEPKKEKQWKPKNHTLKFLGDITVRSCLIRSVNTCSITLLESVGIRNVLDLAKKTEMIKKNNPFPEDLTLSLGSADISPINLVNAFTIFPNLGKYSSYTIINSVKTTTGKVLFREDKKQRQIISPQAAFIITNLLRGVMEDGAGKRLKDIRKPVAGKTGTTNKMQSLWFVGFSPNLVSGVYVGYDNNKSLGKSDYAVKTAMPIWGDFMKIAQNSLAFSNFEEPENIVWRKISKKTGLPYGYKNKHKKKVNIYDQFFKEDLIKTDSSEFIMEAFIKGTEPKAGGSSKFSEPLDLLEPENIYD